MQHSLTVAVSGANFFPAGQVQRFGAPSITNRASSHVGGGGGGGAGEAEGGGEGEAEGGGDGQRTHLSLQSVSC